MQNFYDANRAHIGDIGVRVQGHDVVICAPTGYNLQRLFYLGSEKGPDDIGQYGEGFKVAATCLLRDHHVTPIAMSGTQALCLRIADEPVEGTQLFPLLYDFFELEQPCAGTQLLLPGCSQKLIRAFQQGLTHFFYPNALLGERLWASADGQFLIYASQTREGHVFYRNLLRRGMAQLPLILVIQKEFKSIEDKIRNDRDRNAFGEKLMDTFYSAFAGTVAKHDRNAVRILVQAGEGCWEQGHGLLSALAAKADHYVATLLDTQTSQALFGDRYFARSQIRNDPARQLRCVQMETEWERGGCIGLPGYFSKFGAPNAERRCKEIDAKALLESQRLHCHPPTPAELASIAVLNRALQQMAPHIVAVFSRQHTTYTVAQTEVVLGELKRVRYYRSLDVFLAARVFVSDFPEALAVYLHEHAHIFGHDGDRGFTDALTDVKFRPGLVHRHFWCSRREEFEFG